jgi:hypothetical protein
MTTKIKNHGYEHKSLEEAKKHTSVRERYCLNKFFDALNKKAGFRKYDFNEAPLWEKQFDGTVKIYDKKNNFIAYYIIEAKVREELHKDYIYEKSYKEKILKAKEEKDVLLKEYNLEAGILYINFMWNGVLIWDILDLIEQGKLNRGKRDMYNKKTIASREDKVLKSVYHLQTEDAKFYTDFMFSNKTFLAWYEELKTPKQPQKEEKKTTTYSIF